MEENNNINEQIKTNKAKKNKAFSIFGILIIIVAIACGIYWYLYSSHFVSTDNAYTDVEIAQVTPSIGGTVKEVLVKDTQVVKKGDILVKIDKTDVLLALQQAKANLNLAKQRVQGYMANGSGLNALIQARKADELSMNAKVLSSKANFNKASLDLKRREVLIASGAISKEELSFAKNAYENAKANLSASLAGLKQAQANTQFAIGNKNQNETRIANTNVTNNPEVLLAQAKLDQVMVDLNRTVIKAPIGGIVAKRRVELGQRVQVGAPLLSIVPTQKIYVNANFKEVQLKKVKIGQKAKIHADIYGDDVIYHGIVEGFSAGSGAAFSLIPAQNATGNWIKVVQRIPVRISLLQSELKEHPLKVGLSMNIKIDISKEK